MARLGQGMAQTRDNQPPHDTRFTEPHLRLCRMHIHIHPFRRAFDKERRSRVAIAAEEIGISPTQRPDQKLVAHGATIDEKILRHRRAARIGWQGCQTDEADFLAGCVNLKGVIHEIAAHYLAQSTGKRIKEIPCFGINGKQSAAAIAAINQLEPNAGLGHGEAFDHIGDCLGFGAFGFEEFQSRGGCEKQIAQLHHRAK